MVRSIAQSRGHVGAISDEHLSEQFDNTKKETKTEYLLAYTPDQVNQTSPCQLEHTPSVLLHHQLSNSPQNLKSSERDLSVDMVLRLRAGETEGKPVNI